jgi:hypothetical protein
VRVPFTIYADFESFTANILASENDPDKSYTQQYQKHVPSSFCFNLISTTGEQFEPVTYTANSNDDDVAKIFVEKLEEYAKMIYDKYEKNPKEMTFTDEDVIVYNNAKVCHICEAALVTREECSNDVAYDALQDYTKVRDHCYNR